MWMGVGRVCVCMYVCVCVGGRGLGWDWPDQVDFVDQLLLKMDQRLLHAEQRLPGARRPGGKGVGVSV